MNTINASMLFGEEPLISEEFRNRYSNLFKQTVFENYGSTGAPRAVTMLRRTVDRHYKTAPITYLVKPMADCRHKTFSVRATTYTEGNSRRKLYTIKQEEYIRITKPTYSDKVEGVCRIRERFMNGEHADGEGSNRNCIISITRYRQAFPSLKQNGEDGTTHRDILLCLRLKLSDLSADNMTDDIHMDSVLNDDEDSPVSNSAKYRITKEDSSGNWRTGEKLDSRMIFMMRTHVNEETLKTENEVPPIGIATEDDLNQLEFSMERKQSSEGVLKNAYTNGTPLTNVITNRTSPNTIVFGGPVTVQYDDLTLSLTEGVYVVKGKVPTDAKVNIANARYHVL